MEQPHFLEWFKKLFLPAVSSTLENGPVILLMDGHASHINLELIRPARAYGVILFCLSLDVGVYGPPKEYKKETCCGGRQNRVPRSL